MPLATQGWISEFSTTEELSVLLELVRKVRLESSHEVQVQALGEDRERKASPSLKLAGVSAWGQAM